MNFTYRPSQPARNVLRTVANPFPGWSFYVVHEPSGRIVAFSNSESWCETYIRTR